MYWTLPQTLLWILTGNQTQVDSLPLNKKDDLSLCLEEYTQDKDHPSPLANSNEVQSAITDLKEKARNGHIKCYGQNNENSRNELIPAHEWNSLIIKGKIKPTLYSGDALIWQGIKVDKKDALLQWHSASREPKSNRGRKKGSGTIHDVSALQHMHKLITNHQAKSAHDAAIKTVQELGHKGQSPDADIKRLQKKYLEKP